MHIVTHALSYFQFCGKAESLQCNFHNAKKFIVEIISISSTKLAHFGFFSIKTADSPQIRVKFKETPPKLVDFPIPPPQNR